MIPIETDVISLSKKDLVNKAKQDAQNEIEEATPFTLPTAE